MGFIYYYLFFIIILLGSALIYVAHRDSKEIEKLKKENEELKSQIDGYDR